MANRLFPSCLLPVSNRVLVRNHNHENIFCLQVHFQKHFIWNEDSFWTGTRTRWLGIYCIIAIPDTTTQQDKRYSNPVSLPDLYFDSFSYPVASIVFGVTASIAFLTNSRSCLERYRLAHKSTIINSNNLFLRRNHITSHLGRSHKLGEELPILMGSPTSPKY